MFMIRILFLILIILVFLDPVKAGVIITATPNTDASEVTYTYSGTFNTAVLKLGNGIGRPLDANRVAQDSDIPRVQFQAASGNNNNLNLRGYTGIDSATFTSTAPLIIESNGGTKQGSISNNSFPFRFFYEVSVVESHSSATVLC
jgi:hypothetical protein